MTDNHSSADSGDSKLPLQYEDGPDYCTVRDAQGHDFALTMQPDLMKAMERALSNDIARLMRAPAQPTLDVRWAVNVLLEQIAEGFEKWDTADVWRSEAASYVRARKLALAAQPPAAPVETDAAKTCNSYLQRALDAEADALRLHKEKMEMYERAITAEAKLGVQPSSADTAEVPTDALINLVNHQEQCDEDGVMVKVSRQALAEVLVYVQLVRPDLNGTPPQSSGDPR